MNQGSDTRPGSRLDRLRDALRARVERRVKAALAVEPVYHRRAASAVFPDPRTTLRTVIEHEAFLLQRKETKLRGRGEPASADLLRHLRIQVLREIAGELIPLMPEKDPRDFSKLPKVRPGRSGPPSLRATSPNLRQG